MLTIKELQEQGLKILRATEQLASTGHFAGDDAISQAYRLLNTSTDYQDMLETRECSLRDAIAFFTDTEMVTHDNPSTLNIVCGSVCLS